MGGTRKRRNGWGLALGLLFVVIALLASVGGYLLKQRASQPTWLILIAAPRASSPGWSERVARQIEECRAQWSLPGVGVQRLSQRLESAEQARALGAKRQALLVLWEREREGASELVIEILGSPRLPALGDMLLAEPEQLAYRLRAEGDSAPDLVAAWLAWAFQQDGEAAARWERVLGDAQANGARQEQGAAQLYLALGQMASRAPGWQARAEAALRQAGQLDPASYAARHNLAALALYRCDPAIGLQAAQVEIEAALRLRPGESRALDLLGDLAARQGKWRDALNAYAPAAKAQRTQLALWNKLGRAYQALGQEPEAETTYRTVLDAGENDWLRRKSPAPARIWAEMGLAFQRLGALDQAIGYYLKALERTKDTGERAEFERRLGEVYRQAGAREEALTAFQAALAAEPENAAAHTALADLYLELEQPQAAQAEYEQALAAAPCQAAPYLALGKLYFTQEQYDLARLRLQQGLALCSTDCQAHLALGTLHYLSQEWEQARVAFEQAISLAGEAPSAEPYFGLGNVYLQQKQYEQAIAFYTRALTLAPDDLAALMGLGDAYAGWGQFEPAEAAYRNAARLAPAEAGIRLDLALLYERHGQEPQAQAAAQEALAATVGRTPAGDALAHAILASVARQQGKLPLAATEYEEAIRLQPEEASYHTALALVYIAQNRTAEAVTLAEAALRQRPEDALACFLLGLASEKRGDKERAIQAYEAALRFSGDDQALRKNAEAQLRLLRER